MARPTDMTCQELVALVTEYLEGALTPHDLGRFESHLHACPGCQIYFDQMRRTIQTVGKLDEDDIPDKARERLLHTFRTWKQSQSGG